MLWIFLILWIYFGCVTMSWGYYRDKNTPPALPLSFRDKLWVYPLAFSLGFILYYFILYSLIEQMREQIDLIKDEKKVKTLAKLKKHAMVVNPKRKGRGFS